MRRGGLVALGGLGMSKIRLPGRGGIGGSSVTAETTTEARVNGRHHRTHTAHDAKCRYPDTPPGELTPTLI